MLGIPVPSGAAGETVGVASSVRAAAVVAVLVAVSVTSAAVGSAISAAAYGPSGVPDTDVDGWVSATVPTASAGPVCCPKAAKATTDSAPAARPARRCITLEAPSRLTRSAFRSRGVIVDPNRCAVALPNAGGSRRDAPDEAVFGTCPHSVTGRRRPSPTSAPRRRPGSTGSRASHRSNPTRGCRTRWGRRCGSSAKTCRWGARTSCAARTTCSPSSAPAERAAGAVCASAGNHGQGVAYACRMLGMRGRVHVPRTTPRQKRERIVALGGDDVELVVEGDTYDEAAAAAAEHAARTGATMVPAFDDPRTIAGQGTVGLEILEQLGPGARRGRGAGRRRRAARRASRRCCASGTRRSAWSGSSRPGRRA